MRRGVCARATHTPTCCLHVYMCVYVCVCVCVCVCSHRSRAATSTTPPQSSLLSWGAAWRDTLSSELREVMPRSAALDADKRRELMNKVCVCVCVCIRTVESTVVL